MRVTVFVLLTLSLLKICRFSWNFTRPNKYPHFVILEIYSVDKNSSEEIDTYCRGSILNQRLILTSATKLFRCDPCRTNIVVHTRPLVNQVNASRFIVHDKYKPATSNETYTCGYNIALVLLDKNLKFGEKEKRVAIVRKEVFRFGEKTNLANWQGPFQEDLSNLPLLSRVGKVKAGLIIHINGTTPDDPEDRLVINIQSEHELDFENKANTIYFQYAVDWKNNMTVVNHYKEGKWGKEKPAQFHFSQGEPFVINIRCNTNTFDVKVNNGPYKSFPNEVETVIGREVYVAVTGDVEFEDKYNQVSLYIIDDNGKIRLPSSFLGGNVVRVNFSKCQRKGIKYDGECENNMICVLTEEGDSKLIYTSGTPLVVKDYIQVGIQLESFSPMFTNVSFYYDWITDAAKRLYCDRDKKCHPDPDTSTTAADTPTTAADTPNTAAKTPSTAANTPRADPDCNNDKNTGTNCIPDYDYGAKVEFWGNEENFVCPGECPSPC